MDKIQSKTSGKIKVLIVFMFFLGTALLVMKGVRGDDTPIWVMCIFLGMGFLFSFTLKTVTYEKQLITTFYWITRKEKKFDTYNIASLLLKFHVKTTAESIGFSKPTRIIVIRDVNDKLLHIVDEAVQEHFEPILAMLREGFKDKWLADELK